MNPKIPKPPSLKKQGAEADSVEDKTSTGITVTFNLLNQADALGVVEIIAARYEGAVADLLQELGCGVDAYLNQILEILGVQKFATNPAARIVAKRLSAYISDPREAAQTLRRELRWQVSVDGAVRILMNMVDGLAPTQPLKNFVDGLLQVLQGDPLVVNYKIVIQAFEGLQIKNLGVNSTLVSILEKYVIANGEKAREAAEKIWDSSETAESVSQIIDNLQKLFPEVGFAEVSTTELAAKLIKARKNQVFFNFMAKAVSYLGFEGNMNFNGPLSVIMNHVRGQLNLTDYSDENAQTIAANLRSYFQEMVSLTKISIRQKLVDDHGLSEREEKHRKGLEFLVEAIAQTFGCAQS